MSDQVLPPPSDEAPIDAEFEPAPKRKPKAEKKSGPGWFSFLILGGISLGALALSVLSSGFLSDANNSDTLAADVERLKVDTQAATEERATLRDLSATAREDVEDANDDIAALNTKLTDVSDALGILEGDLMAAQDAGDLGLATNTDAINTAPLMARIEGLEAMVAALPEDTTVQARDGDAPVATTASVDVTEIESALAQVRSDVDRLRDELTTLRGDLSGLIEAQDTMADAETAASNGASAAVALSAIEAAARRGQPFQMAYETLSDAAPEMRGVDALRRLAATGAPTLPDLRDAFLPLKRTALKIDADSKGGTASVLQSLFGDGVKVRRADEVDTASVLETAQTALVTGDIEAALSAIDTLSPDIQAVFTDWRDDAQNRLTLEDSLDTLRLAMIAKDRP